MRSINAVLGALLTKYLLGFLNSILIALIWRKISLLKEIMACMTSRMHKKQMYYIFPSFFLISRAVYNPNINYYL